MTCGQCGATLTIGAYPFCPHGFPAQHRTLEAVTWPGGKTFENGFATPQTFYSPTEYRAALAAQGLTVRGDGEEHFAWISKDALEKAKELVSRADRA